MILELSGAAVALGAGLLYWARQRRVPARPAVLEGPRETFAVGDVLLYRGRERLLQGALFLHDGGWTARLFEAEGERGIRDYVLLWKHNVAFLAPAQTAPASPLPSSLHHDGRWLELVRQAKMPVRREGSFDRLNVDMATLALFTERGGRVLLVAETNEHRLALSGERVELDEIEVLPGR